MIRGFRFIALLVSTILAVTYASASWALPSRETPGTYRRMVLSSPGVSRGGIIASPGRAMSHRDAAEKQKRRKKDSYRAAMLYAANPSSAPVSFNPSTPYTGDECRAKHQYGGFDYKDRFSYCFIQYPQLDYQVCDRRSCRGVGFETFRLTEVGVGTDGSQTLKTWISLDTFIQHGETFPQDTMQLNAICGWIQAECKSNMPLGISQSIATWRSQSNRWIEFSYTFLAGATDWTTGDSWDKRDRQHFHESQLGIANPNTGQEIHYDPISFRCDGAAYVKTGCIFDKVAAVWVVDKAKYPAIAAHIKLAQDQPGTGSLPKSPGVVIPGGKSSNIPLTRNYWSTIARYKADRKPPSASLEDQSRKKSIKMCITLFSTPGHPYTKGPNGEAYDCDEYPFASTYEGSATTGRGTKLWYSVQALPASQNRGAGASWSVWLKRNHILDRDPFWVEVP